MFPVTPRIPQSLRRTLRPAKRAAEAAQWQLRRIGSRLTADPVFVLGNQKAGTSAIAALLGLAAGKSTTIDLKREARDPKYRQAYGNDIEFGTLVRRNVVDFSREIIKEPHLSVFFEQLERRFPDARFVFIVRRPEDNLRSILDRLGIAGNLDIAVDAAAGGLPEAWRLVVDGRWLGIDERNYIAQLAERWNRIADVYLYRPNRMILVRYEDFLADKKGTTARLAAALGWMVKSDISGKTDYPFQPPGVASVRLEDFFGENLRMIREHCGERMTDFRYRIA